MYFFVSPDLFHWYTGKAASRPRLEPNELYTRQGSRLMEVLLAVKSYIELRQVTSVE